MRKFRLLIILFIVIPIGIVMAITFDQFIDNVADQIEENQTTELPKIESNQTTKEFKELLKGDIFQLMNKTSSEIENELGKPIRKDLTPYGYTWWVYRNDTEFYLLVGIKDDYVETIFATGKDVASEPFSIGTSYNKIKKQFPFKNKVTYQTGLSFYSFLLNEEDLKVNPLIELGDNLFIQCYFDTFTDSLSSIRIATGDVLIRQRFYEMEYRGTLPPEESLSEDEWKKIEKGMEEQIFELTNILRDRFDLKPLAKDEEVSEVAFLHSKDMYENNYFSHYGLDGSGLKERLEEKQIFYLSAGENIAAQHTDAPAAVEGWLNSEGHREALLNEGYTHLGVGVHRLYYTQNFILKH